MSEVWWVRWRVKREVEGRARRKALYQSWYRLHWHIRTYNTQTLSIGKTRGYRERACLHTCGLVPASSSWLITEHLLQIPPCTQKLWVFCGPDMDDSLPRLVRLQLQIYSLTAWDIINCKFPDYRNPKSYLIPPQLGPCEFPVIPLRTRARHSFLYKATVDPWLVCL